MRGLLAATVISLAAAMPAKGADDSAFECKPALKFFCANIHIGCAGRSNIPTADFTLSFESPDAIASFADGTTLRSRAVFSFRKEDSAIVLRDGQDWIRVEADGLYSQRIYRKGQPLMTRGTCGPAEPQSNP